jgi:hypothetical protein
MANDNNKKKKEIRIERLDDKQEDKDKEKKPQKKQKESNRVVVKIGFDFYVDESKVTEANAYYEKVDGVRLAIEQAIKEQIPKLFDVKVDRFVIEADSTPVMIDVVDEFE